MLDIATTTAKLSVFHDIMEFVRSLPISSNTFQHVTVQEYRDFIKIQVDDCSLQTLAFSNPGITHFKPKEETLQKVFFCIEYTVYFKMDEEI